MAIILKTGINPAAADAVDQKVRETVEQILNDVKTRGDLAIRELSQRFDHWSPANFRLSTAAIEELIASLPNQVVADIQFAQAQVRHLIKVTWRRKCR